MDVNEILDNISRAVNNVPDQNFYNSQKSFKFHTQKLRAFFERFTKFLCIFSTELEKKGLFIFLSIKTKLSMKKSTICPICIADQFQKQKNLFFFLA